MAATIEQLTALAAGDDMVALLSCCEEFELDLGHKNLTQEASVGVYKIYLLAYFLCDQLDNARFLWKRIPAASRDADAELCAIWAIGNAMWVKDSAAAQGAMLAHAWSQPLVSGLVARLQREHMSRTFAEIAKAYSLIRAESGARALGVSVAKFSEMANAAGWTVDAESGAYVPHKEEETERKPQMMEQLQMLTDYVAHIEKEVK